MRKEYKSIQALRAVAAIAVVIFHSASVFGPAASAILIFIPLLSDRGSLGVKLFFVISGFIISHVLSNKQDITTYFYRRFWRIYPVYTVANLAVLALWYWQDFYRADVADLGLTGIIKSFLIFPQLKYPLNNPGWTLENEIVFYVIAGVAVPLIGLGGTFVLLAALGTASFAFLVFPAWGFEVFTSLQFYFAAGIIAYRWRNIPASVAFPFAVAMCWIGTLYIYGYFEPLQLIQPRFDPIFYDVIVSLWMLSIVVGAVTAERLDFRFPRLLISLGNISYSLYIFHAIVLAIFAVSAARLGLSLEYTELLRWTAIGTAVAVAYASYFLIERPFIRFARGAVLSAHGLDTQNGNLRRPLEDRGSS